MAVNTISHVKTHLPDLRKTDLEHLCMTKPKQWRHSFIRILSMRFLARTWMEWISAFHSPMCKSCFKHAELFLGLENGSIISLCMSSQLASASARLQTIWMCPKHRSCFRTIKGALTQNNIFFVVVFVYLSVMICSSLMSFPCAPVSSWFVPDPISLFVMC